MDRTIRLRPPCDSDEDIQIRARARSAQRGLIRGSLPPASQPETRVLDDPQLRVTFLLSIRQER